MALGKRICAAHLWFSVLVLIGLLVNSRFAFAEEGFYVGLSGGMNWIRDGKSGSDVAGGNLNGTVYDIEGDNGLLVGGVVGYRFSDLFRADVSYTRLNNELNWKGAFPGGGDSAFASDASSDVFMLNGYLHAKGLNKGRFYTFDPFVGAGIGLTSNRLNDIVETGAGNGAFRADVHDGKTIRPAARLGVGVDTRITPALTLTSSVDAYWLGDFESAESRNIAGFQRIGAWQIDDVMSLGMTVGFRYSF
jgi:hypothetical protein